MVNQMTAYISAEDRKTELTETSMTFLEQVFLFFIIVLLMASAIHYLNLAPGVSGRSDVQDDALGIYNQHRMKLDELSKKYYGELVSAKKKIQSIGDN